MAQSKRRVHHWPSLVMMIIYLFLLQAKTTDADLFDSFTIANNTMAATTLDLSVNETTSNRLQQFLFNISGLVAGGYQLSAIKLTNLGQVAQKVNLSIRPIANQNSLCDELSIKILNLKLETLYEGILTQASVNTALLPDKQADLVIMLASKQTELDPNKNRCNFDIIFEGRNQNNTSGGFFDEEIVQNYVQTNIY